MKTDKVLKYHSQDFNQEEAKVNNWFRENRQEGSSETSLTLVIVTEVPKRYNLIDTKSLETVYSNLNWESVLKVQEDFQADIDEDSIKFLRAAPPESIYPVFEKPKYQGQDYIKKVALKVSSWVGNADSLDEIELIDVLRGSLLGALTSLLLFTLHGTYERRLENQWLLLNIPAVILTVGIWWVSDKHVKYLRASIREESDPKSNP
jgi:hypothetical protein